MDKIYHTLINETKYAVELDEKVSVNGDIQNVDFSKVQKGSYSFNYNGRNINTDVVKIDYETKQVVLRIEGKKYTVNIKEPVDIQLEKLGINTLQAKKVNNLKAPMPGLVIKTLVREGDHVKAGEPLLILEAMKMENIFKAAADVIIKTIKVTEKQAVEKGQELITFE
jgi:biotin carboxyl carrier protein